MPVTTRVDVEGRHVRVLQFVGIWSGDHACLWCFVGCLDWPQSQTSVVPHVSDPGA